MTTTFNKNVPASFNLIDENGNVFSDTKFSTTLTSGGGAQDVTVPNDSGMGGSVGASNFFLVTLKPQPGTTVRVSNEGTATLPGGAFASSNSETIPPNGMIMRVKGGSTLSFITPDTSAYVDAIFRFTN